MSDRAARLKDAEATMRMLQHEVRTPLGHIIGYSEMLEEEVLENDMPELTEDLEKIRTAARRILDLVDGKLLTNPDDEIAHVPSADRTSVEPSDDELDPAVPSESSLGRILIVESDIDAAERLAQRLRGAEYSVAIARDGIDALRRISQVAFDLVVLDVLLPGMGGLEVLERIRRSRSMSELPVLLVAELNDPGDAIEGLQRGGNDFISKPYVPSVVVARVESQLASHRSARQVAVLARQLEFRNAFMRQALGRHVSEDLLVELSERPDATALGGERRKVIALVADVRGTRRWSSECEPSQVFEVLNNVFSPLSDVVQRYGGSIDSVAGDSLVALFGLPTPQPDDAERATACGVAMQLAVPEINARNRRAGIPEIAIGVGIAAGRVLVGGIGKGEGLRFKALGSPAIHASLLERLAKPGEVVICDRTRDQAGECLVLAGEPREIDLPDAEGPEPIHSVLGVGGGQLISLRSPSEA